MPEEHGNHWRRAVLSHAEMQTGGNNFWVRMDELSAPADHAQPLLRIRFRVVNPGQYERAVAWLKKLSAVATSIDDPGFGFQVFRNRFVQGSTGPAFANVNSFDDWATMDKERDMPFAERFEKIHGAGSYAAWSKAGPEIFADQYDEVWSHVPWLSSPEVEARR